MLYRRAIFVDEMRILCRIIGGSHTIKSYSKLTPSKLMLKLDGEIIANYDRGWDIEPTCEEANLALCILLNENN